ncbi:MAG: radical SAM protein [Candidatus Hydrogenedentota bacterium]
MNYLNLLVKIVRSRLGLINMPSLCIFLVTGHCNCRCPGCDIWKYPDRVNDMTLDEIKNVFNEDLRCLEVLRLSGGEPFMRSDFPQIVQHLLKVIKPSYIQITTNGLLYERILSFMEEFGNQALHLIVSIDGIGEAHDRSRGINGAFDKVIKTATQLAKLRLKKKFFLAVTQIVSPDRLEEIPKLREILESIGISNINYSPFTYLLKKDISIEQKFDFLKIPKEKAKAIFTELEKAKPQDVFIRKLIYKYYHKGLKNRLLYEKYTPKFICTVLSNYFRILSTGDVVICNIYDKPIGNLKKTSFRQLWYSPEADTARKIARNCRGCWYGCEVIPNAVYTGDIIRALF